MIISGGFNVYPREIEIALEELEGVAEAAVVGVPHQDFGEGVVAAVIAEPGARLDPAALAAGLAASLTAYKRPKTIRVVEGFPRNAMGKLLRGDLAERFGDVFAPAGQ
jgi:malonyl-CoA/methylmalonyl-CoA synthetase